MLRSVDRVGLGAAGIAWLSIGVTELLAGPGRGPAWWLAWLAFGVAYAFADTGEAADAYPLQPRSGRYAAALVLAVAPLGVAVVLLSSIQGLSGVALVMVAVLATQLLPPRAALALIGTQTLIVAATGLLVQPPAARVGVLVTGMAFFAFQIFAFLTASALRTAEAARREAEAAHAELARAQARLAETSRAEERLRIARDLHDSIGHQLTGLSVNLQLAAHSTDGEARARVELCRAVAAGLLDDVRAVVGRLRDGGTDPTTALPQRLGALGATVPRPVVHVDVAPDLPMLPVGVETALVRCVQEALTNAARHGDAEHLFVSVEELDGVVTVTARDDGAGAETVRPGNGLKGMSERVAALGGEVAWRAAPGSGFWVQASFPVPAGGPPAAVQAASSARPDTPTPPALRPGASR